jgi:hypothetical protein
MAQEAGAASGFPGAQMLETIFAKKYGPESSAPGETVRSAGRRLR